MKEISLMEARPTGCCAFWVVRDRSVEVEAMCMKGLQMVLSTSGESLPVSPTSRIFISKKTAWASYKP